MLMGWIWGVIVAVLWAIGFSLTFRTLWRREVLATDDAYVKCYRKRARDAYNSYQWGDKTKLPSEEWVLAHVNCPHPGGHTEKAAAAVWGSLFWPFYWAYTLWWRAMFSKKPIKSAALTELHTDLRLARQLAEVEAELAMGEQLVAATTETKRQHQADEVIHGRQALPSSKMPRARSAIDSLPADSPLRPALEEMLAAMEKAQSHALPGTMFSWDIQVSTGLDAPVKTHVPAPIKVTDRRRPNLMRYPLYGYENEWISDVTIFQE